MIITDKKLPERRKYDEYITPKPFIYSLYKYIYYEIDNLGVNCKVLDAGAGTGNWGNVFKETFSDRFKSLEITGVELQDLPKPDGYDRWLPNTNFINYPIDTGYSDTSYYDVSLGNPPYKYVHRFLDNMFELTGDAGLIILLLRNAFMESKIRYDKYFSNAYTRPYKIIQSVRRISFDYEITGSAKSNDTAYSVFMWRAKTETYETKFEWLNWDYSA